MSSKKPIDFEIADLRGWTLWQGINEWQYLSDGKWLPLPRPATNRADALELLEYVCTQPQVNSVDVCQGKHNQKWVCFVSDIRSTPHEIVDLANAAADTLPAAIALACRDALRVLKEEAKT